ncbi:MAG: nickel-dependent hydrogenase large subunit [Coriobacteriia bacterium]|nr:nickel-dependent hydrogenase large subunit [Coriobacteriia bacterium]
MATITVDPVTRIEGHLRVQVETAAEGTVTSAKVAGQLYRDFENILVGRAATDPVHLTQRVCGVCPVSHAIVASKTVEAALRFTPNAQAQLLRALIQGGNFVQDHILHFYHLNLMDYIEGPAMAPWSGANTSDLRITGSDRERLIANYLKALDIRRKAQEMVAILAGKVPHVATVMPGGVTQSPSVAQMTAVKGLLAEVTTFVRDTYVPDAEFLASKYDDYFHIGRGAGALLSFGVFDQPGSTPLLKRGLITAAGRRGIVDVKRIAEEVARSYYTARPATAPAAGVTAPAFGKSGAYSWLKAPRYAGGVYEVGPLARMTVNGDYKGGISVMDRTLARAYEARKIVAAMGGWAARVQPGAKTFTPLGAVRGTAFGLTEAPRGALGHWATFSANKVSRYQMITPTCWNASPRDGRGVPGTMEQALTGLRVADPAKPIELMRVVHSYDPCTGCSVHVTDVDGLSEHVTMLTPPSAAGR